MKTRNGGKQVHLFPRLPHHREPVTAPYSKWVNRYLSKTCGISDPAKVFHSFRHTFKDALREAGVPVDINNALSGHKDGSVAGGYGLGYSLRVLDEAIQRMSFPDLLMRC